MSILLTIVGVVFAILQIILFFKLWGMTNDVREIKNKYFSTSIRNTDISVGDDENISLNGKLVVNLATNKQMRVKGSTDEGKFKCYAGGVHVGDFDRSEIVDFDYWVQNNKR